ncbi:hypothetical protein JCGZ_18666 [Jatropha curcas]|uniref:Uncharacterized protein n=1 Tax=Jatropha curcas TaxID=180498 RepID=A0A067K0L4_JATCU|nr:uncharacterized protein LOC105641649 [Jatropha curcas]KDP29731.1 hypothetical protein JCGZ_18666 [Jatropha curcas]
MARWASSNNHKLSYRGFDDENDMFMGVLVSPKSGKDLMQNCDLPTPLKMFSGCDKTVISPMTVKREKEEERSDFDVKCGGENEKLELLKALRLSQTRAREAEEKAANLAKDRDSITNVLLKESMQLFAYRQWVRLLEFQVLKLQSQKKKLLNEGGADGDDGVSWFMALAFCLGIAGVGLAFGCRYLF